MRPNIEVLQQLAFEDQLSQYPELKEDIEVWQETVLEMYERGFDIQLHLHPQWYEASYDGDYWHLDKRWNITDYSRPKIEGMFDRALDYLNKLLPNENEIISFRSGAWATCCPSNDLFEVLEKYNFIFDISLVPGVFYDGESLRLDYLSKPPPSRPYYPNYDDARDISGTKKEVIEIPTQSVSRECLNFSFIEKIQRKVLKFWHNKSEDTNLKNSSEVNLPDHIIDDPFGFGSGQAIESSIILDLSNNVELLTFKKMIQHLLEEALQSELNQHFFVFENHTKNLMSAYKFDHIRQYIIYIRRKYGSHVRFLTMQDLAENVQLIENSIEERHDL